MQNEPSGILSDRNYEIGDGFRRPSHLNMLKPLEKAYLLTFVFKVHNLHRSQK